ncbi:hypothetical protein ATANTOWER_027777 [Ataeniobius toweri]|uniref:Secreted protein n=1 Tax=Ataeniobius toweri TaxID=208326 RepID=A0ABU7AHQ8_9TELE|nr:hypothetical protein [Ataeniobius toweri]
MFHALCQVGVIFMLALQDVRLRSLLFKFYSLHCAGASCLSSNPLSWDGECFCPTAHSPPHVWFQGEFRQSMMARALFPVPDGNQSIISSVFFRHGANQI